MSNDASISFNAQRIERKKHMSSRFFIPDLWHVYIHAIRAIKHRRSSITREKYERCNHKLRRAGSLTTDVYAWLNCRVFPSLPNAFECNTLPRSDATAPFSLLFSLTRILHQSFHININPRQLSQTPQQFFYFYLSRRTSVL